MTSGTSTGSPPRISFLTSAYRTEAFLPDTIASVVAQTNGAWELVVVDNGNDDALAAIVSNHDDPRIKLVRQENKGYSGGVMAAAAAASGEYVAVLDSDDQLMPEFVEVMLAQFDHHPVVDVVACDAHLFSDDGDQPDGRGYLRSVGVRVPPAEGDVLTVEDVLAGRVPYYTSVIRRTAWEAVGGYDPGIEGIDESVLIWLRLASRFRIRLLRDRLARYRVRSDSLSRDPDKVEAFEKALISTFELFGEQTTNPGHRRIVEGPIRRLRYHQALRRARWAFADQDVTGSLRFARDAFRYRPTPRAAAVVVLLQLAPTVLRRVYPLKQRLTQVARRARQRILV